MTLRRIRDVMLTASTILVAASTLVLVGMAIVDRSATRASQADAGKPPPEFLDRETWRRVAGVGHRRGPDTADVTIVTFSDFECPMCGAFATRTFPTFQDEYDGTVAEIYRHWPLSRHRFAYAAARAAECAAARGHFFEFHDAIYSQQGLLGVKTFREFAEESGIPDLEAFDKCVSDTQPVPEIERDIEMVRDLGGTGTPTVVVNGWLLKGGVGVELLDSIVRHAAPNYGG